MINRRDVLIALSLFGVAGNDLVIGMIYND